MTRYGFEAGWRIDAAAAAALSASQIFALVRHQSSNVAGESRGVCGTAVTSELAGYNGATFSLDASRGEVPLPFQANIIHRPGIHNLQMLKVTLKDDGDSDDDEQGGGGEGSQIPSFHFPMQQWLVTAIDTGAAAGDATA
eukprot:CAMPEP_0119560488 /NCGR_PEP_ID=MMETSP1352-20130426/14965_1 /TAXON_ID=265584 /ORGANISM="Stauroneis constricta, Strain CCMP1120" /LENGTH=139 /DNA_ID=CAMNT_0007608471 /DNA_START=245 /DNA_END=663 /DNA_ORIENTATION=-